jgi:hypothetical protein
MTTKPKIQRTATPGPLALPLSGGDAAGTKYLIGAVLVAGKDGCQCEACQLLKKFGGELGAALLKEEASAGD